MKKVIAYLHTHWDREWYREFEVFRLRLLRVFDNVLDMLEQNKIPSFYFDGQVVALLDYLEMRPEREKQVRKFIKEKRLFIGPFYCLVDEFLTDGVVFRKNLEIGLKIAREFGCEDFIGYLADTFGHSKNIPPILKEYGIDKIMVWRGVGDLPSEFIFNGVNTVNLVRGYFMDIFSANMTIEKKAEWLKSNLNRIAEKSSDVLLLPIGADHLGVETDIKEQIDAVNKLLKGEYEIVFGSPFDYFKQVKFKTKFNDELRDNSKTFILQGSYSARTKLKQYNVQCSYLLEQADKVQQKYGNKYASVIEYAYKLLLQNQAHDSICGCSTDMVHIENQVRYEKILQIAETVIEELRLIHEFKTPVMESLEPLEGYDIIGVHNGFDNKILYDTQKIPVTEDYSTVYTLQKTPKKHCDVKLELKDGHFYIGGIEVLFTRCKDKGDTYNFGAVKNDKYEVAKMLSFDGRILKTSFFDVEIIRGETLVNFRIEWNNRYKNKLWQVKFVMPKPVDRTFSEDMNELIERRFAPDYEVRKHLPKTRGIEVKTNFAPMQRMVWTQDFGVITCGLTEYEAYKNMLSITLLRSVGVISNPKNPCRSTPAGPPIEVFEAQQLGYNSAELFVGFFDIKEWKNKIKEVYPDYV